MKTLVLGIGSPIMSDDAIGLRTLQELEKMNLENVDLQEACTSGLDLIEVMIGYDKVIIIDAIINYSNEPGKVMILDADAFSDSVHGVNAHEANIPSTIALGKKLAPDTFPHDIRFIAIEAKDVFTVSDEMSPELEAALPVAVETVLRLIRE